MAIDLSNEQALSLSEAAAALPKVDGKRPHISTLWRWCREGLRGVSLDYVRIGHRIVTSREALSRFANALADVDKTQPLPRRSNPTPSRRPRSAAARQRAIATAEHNTAALGI